jgi:hypothetical protein
VSSSALNPIALTHVTIARNRATFDGGGIFLFGDPEVELENVILAENEPSNCGGFKLQESASENLADDNSCQLSGFGDVDDTDAQLGTLGYYGGFTRSIPPLPGSPAIETGGNAGINVDQRGVARPQQAQFDKGALELVGGRAKEKYKGGLVKKPKGCDLDRNGRIDFADLDRLIATFPVAGGRFRGNADRRLKDCVESCTHAGCPAVALIPKPRQRD